MKDRNKKSSYKQNLVCYSGFIVEAIIIALCYIIKSANWISSESMTVTTAMIQAGIILLILLMASLLVCVSFKSQTIEKKFLFMLGCVAVSLGVLGFSDLVIQNKLSFLDATYKSIQFFVGEYETIDFGGGIPPMINVARFLALAVTFGTIGIILLKKRIYYLNLKLFYKDIVIITDRPEAYITDLAKKFMNENRKVIIGYTANDRYTEKTFDGDIPTVNIDINKNIVLGLQICNIKNAKNIFLLCKKTEDNIKLVKAIFPMFNQTNNNNSHIEDEEDNTQSNTIGGLIEDYCYLIKNPPHDIIPETKGNANRTICYIQYQTDREREYYSIDDVFTNRIDNFDTYFVNIYDISVRQMITKISIKNALEISGQMSVKAVIEKLNNIRIAVAGSGEMLSRTVLEIVKNCVYSSQTPMKIYHIVDKGSRYDNITCDLPAQLDTLIEIEAVTARQLKDSSETINLLFISSADEKEIRSVLHEIFQYDIQNQIYQYLILTKGYTVEYNILKTYINTLLNPYMAGKKNHTQNQSVLYLSRIANLMQTIEAFYQQFGPTSKEVHEAYSKAIVNDELRNFSKLPEIYIDSNILSALHNNFIIQVINTVINEQPDDESSTQPIRELFEYLAVTEHERWYNERYIQGCIYSEEQSHIYHKNRNLLHWENLSIKQKEDNIRYVIGALIAQYKKGMETESNDTYKDLITKYIIK